MTPFFWTMLALLLATGGLSAASFVVYIGNGVDLWRERAVRFFRWAVVVVLATFDITIFKHIVLTIVRW